MRHTCVLVSLILITVGLSGPTTAVDEHPHVEEFQLIPLPGSGPDCAGSGCVGVGALVSVGLSVNEETGRASVCLVRAGSSSEPGLESFAGYTDGTNFVGTGQSQRLCTFADAPNDRVTASYWSGGGVVATPIGFDLGWGPGGEILIEPNEPHAHVDGGGAVGDGAGPIATYGHTLHPEPDPVFADNGHQSHACVSVVFNGPTGLPPQTLSVGFNQPCASPPGPAP